MVTSISLTKNKAIKLLEKVSDAIVQGQQPPPSMPCSWCASPPEGGPSVVCSIDHNFPPQSRPTGCSSLPLTSPLSSQTSSSTVRCQNLNVYVVGRVGHPKAQIVRVVHISDTRGASEYYANGGVMPNGHILIHSGDFLDGPPVRSRPSTRPRITSCTTAVDEVASVTWKNKLSSVNEFFQRQPHPYKIFVPGCWDYFGPDRPSPAEIQQHLPSVIYLEDACCQILGLKVYGVPWTSADDLRPEDGKYHFPRETASVVARLRRWLAHLGIGSRKTATTTATSEQRQRRLRCMSSSCGGGVSAGQNAESVATSPAVWPMVDSPDTSGGDNASSSSSKSTSSNFSSVAARCTSPICDGFILPNIQAVADRYAHVPSDTNILISHMPAWRPELLTHVVNRIQ